MLNTLREKLEKRGLQIIDISIEHVVVRFQEQEASRGVFASTWTVSAEDCWMWC